MSWKFGTVCAGVSALSAATSWGSRGSHLGLRPSSREKPPWPDRGMGRGLRVLAVLTLQCAGAGGEGSGAGSPGGGKGPLVSEVYCHVQHCGVTLPLC